VWWPPAGEHFGFPGFEPWRKIVPLPVTGRVDHCWDVFLALAVPTALPVFLVKILACRPGHPVPPSR
jgi:hypothetical protein